MDKEQAVLTRRPARYAQYSYGDSERRGYNGYESSTRGYYDGYEEGTPRPTTTRKSVIGPQRPDRGRNEVGWKAGTSGGGSQRPPSSPNQKPGTAAAGTGSREGLTPVCRNRPVQLSLHPNFSINAESIANMTRRTGDRAPSWTTLLPCHNWTWNESDPSNPPYRTIVTEVSYNSSWHWNNSCDKHWLVPNGM